MCYTINPNSNQIALKQENESLRSQLSSMTADRDYWKSQANGRLNFKTVTITLNILEYGQRMNGTVAHGCGVIPKYVFTKLSWIYSDNHPQVTNFFLSNLGIINFDIDLA